MCTAVFLRNVYNGSSFLVDLHREKEINGEKKFEPKNAYRVCINNVPAQYAKMKMGDIVDITAGVTGKGKQNFFVNEM